MRSPFIFISTLAALGLATLAVLVWGTRPEPALMLFTGAGLAIAGGAARKRERRDDDPAEDNLGAFRS